jgi:hypothetical protein
MKKNIIILGLCLIFLLVLPFASADLNNGLISFFEYENNLTDQLGNHDMSIAQGVGGYTSGKFLQGFEATNDVAWFAENSELDNSFSIGSWINYTTINDAQFSHSVFVQGYDNYYLVVQRPAGNQIGVAMYDGSNSAGCTSAGTYTNNVLYNVVATVNRTSDVVRLYVDGVEVCSDDISGLSVPAYTHVGAGLESLPTYNDAVYDDFFVSDRVWTQTDVDEWYNSGNGFEYPFSAPVVVVNESAESTSIVKQTGSVSFTVTPTTILSSTFEVLNNNTDLYGGYTLELESNGNNNVYCEIQINGTVYANKTRSNLANQVGNMFIMTPVFTVDAGNYTSELICERTSGVGITSATNSVGVGHLLYDEQNNTIPHNNITISDNVNSGNSWTLIDTFNITTGDNNNTVNYTNHIVIEGSLSYTNNDVSSDTLGTYMNVAGTNCSFYPRTVGSGNTGSVGVDCIVSNVSNSTTYTVSIYGNGTNADYEGNLVVKSFYLGFLEVVGGTGEATGLTFSDATDTALFSAPGGNIHHALSNVFTKSSVSLTSDKDTTVKLWITLENGSTYQTINFTRYLSAGETGVLIGQDVLEGVPLDDYNTTIWGNCGTIGANCTFSGGQTGGYITDITTTVFNSFNVTVYDLWDNSTILNFSVVDGGTYSTTTGSVEIFSTDIYENLTFSSSNYLDYTVYNHNTSIDLNQSLYQTNVTFATYEILTGALLSGLNYTVGGEQLITNDIGWFGLKAGSYTVLAEKNGYFDRNISFSVDALFEGVVNVTDMSNTIINLTAIDVVTGSTVANFSGWIYHDPTSTNITFNTTTGVVEIPSAQTNFTLYVTTTGDYATVREEIVVNATVFNYSISLYPYNSVRINIYDGISADLLNQTTTITTVTNTTVFTNTTDNGTIIISFLTPNSYELRFNSSGYNSRSVFISVTADSTQEINVYMTSNASVELQRVEVISLTGSNVQGAVVKLQKQTADEEDVYYTVDEKSTNSEGQTAFYLIKDVTVYYRFIVVYDDVVKLISDETFFLSVVDEIVTLQIDVNTVSNRAEIGGLGVVTSLVRSGASNETVTYTWSDANNEISGARMDIYVQNLNRTDVSPELYYSVASSDADGNFVYSLPVVNNTKFIVKGFITVNGVSTLYEEKIVIFGESQSERNVSLLLSIVVFIITVLLTLELGALFSGLFGFASLIVLSIIGLVTIPLVIITSFMAFIVIIFIDRGVNK